MATVLDVHPVRRGDRAGYRQRRISRDGWLVIMAGGTAHGIGMEAPTSASSGRQRLVALAQGGLQATGRALSPYTIAGAQALVPGTAAHAGQPGAAARAR